MHKRSSTVDSVINPQFIAHADAKTVTGVRLA